MYDLQKLGYELQQDLLPNINLIVKLRLYMEYYKFFNW